MSVAFSLPNIPSFTKTTPDESPILFIPDTKYLIKFVNGDLGIADSIQKSMILKNFSTITKLNFVH